MIKLICSALLAMAFLLSPCAQAQAAPQKAPKAPLLAPQNVPPAPSFGNPSQQRIPSILQNPKVPLAPFAEYFVDATGKMVIEDLVKDGISQKFSPLHLSKIKEKKGVLWIRLVLSPTHLESGTPPPVFLDLGNAPASAIYTLEAPLENAEPEWREKACSERLLVLPEAGAETEKPIFLRFDTLPGRWFAPTLRTAENAATDYTAYYHAAGIVSLCVLMLVCLLSAFVEAGSWRLWALLYLAAVGTQALAGVPAGNGIASATMALPGLCVFLYPQVGRHLLRCPQEARFLNAQFVLLSLVGLALAALPFIPQFGWVSRYVDCWPLALAIFVPTALFGLIYRRPGAGRLLLGSALPPIAVALAWFCANSDRFSPEFMGALPLWGTVLGAVLVTGLPCKTPTPCPQADWNIDAPDNAPKPESKAGAPLSLESQPAQKSTMEAKDGSSQPLSLKSQVLNMGKQESLSLSMPIQNGLPPLGGGQKASEGLSLNFDPAPSAQPQPASAPTPSDAAPAPAPAFEDEQDEVIDESAEVTLVNLKELLLRAKDTAQMHALNSRCQLQWSTTQQVDSLYEGPAQLLLKTLDVCCKELCLKKGSLATFSFSHAPEGEGKDLFAVALTGQSQFSRRSLAFARKLSSESAGTMRLDCGKQENTLRFTVRFSPAGQRQQQNDTPRSPLLQPDSSKAAGPTLEILLLADRPQVSVRILSLLKNLPAHVRLAARAEDLLSQQRKNPAHLVIIQGKAATPNAAPLIKAMLASPTPPESILAYTVDDSTWNDLALAGFTHALTLPIEQDPLLETFFEVMGESFPQGSEAVQQAIRQQSKEAGQNPQAPAGQPIISPEKKGASSDMAQRPLEGSKGEDATGATQKPQGNAASQKSRIFFYLEQAKRCLGFSKMGDLAIAAATIAAIAAQEKLEDVSRLAGILTKAARIQDEEKAKEALEALSLALDAQK